MCGRCTGSWCGKCTWVSSCCAWCCCCRQWPRTCWCLLCWGIHVSPAQVDHTSHCAPFQQQPTSWGAGHPVFAYGVFSLWCSTLSLAAVSSDRHLVALCGSLNHFFVPLTQNLVFMQCGKIFKSRCHLAGPWGTGSTVLQRFYHNAQNARCVLWGLWTSMYPVLGAAWLCQGLGAVRQDTGRCRECGALCGSIHSSRSRVSTNRHRGGPSSTWESHEGAPWINEVISSKPCHGVLLCWNGRHVSTALTGYGCTGVCRCLNLSVSLVAFSMVMLPSTWSTFRSEAIPTATFHLVFHCIHSANTSLCGPVCSRDASREFILFSWTVTIFRAGYQGTGKGEVFLGGRNVELNREQEQHRQVHSNVAQMVKARHYKLGYGRW